MKKSKLIQMMRKPPRSSLSWYNSTAKIIMISPHTSLTSLEEQKKKQTSKKLPDYGFNTQPLPDLNLKTIIMQKLRKQKQRSPTRNNKNDYCFTCFLRQH